MNKRQAASWGCPISGTSRLDRMFEKNNRKEQERYHSLKATLTLEKM